VEFLPENYFPPLPYGHLWFGMLWPSQSICLIFSWGKTIFPQFEFGGLSTAHTRCVELPLKDQIALPPSFHTCPFLFTTLRPGLEDSSFWNLYLLRSEHSPSLFVLLQKRRAAPVTVGTGRTLGQSPFVEFLLGVDFGELLLSNPANPIKFAFFLFKIPWGVLLYIARKGFSFEKLFSPTSLPSLPLVQPFWTRLRDGLSPQSFLFYICCSFLTVCFLETRIVLRKGFLLPFLT